MGKFEKIANGLYVNRSFSADPLPIRLARDVSVSPEKEGEDDAPDSCPSAEEQHSEGDT
jgi:hypothetical protein